MHSNGKPWHIVQLPAAGIHLPHPCGAVKEEDLNFCAEEQVKIQVLHSVS